MLPENFWEEYKFMPLKIETIKKILGIQTDVDLTPSEMAKNLKIIFFPHEKNENNNCQ